MNHEPQDTRKLEMICESCGQKATILVVIKEIEDDEIIEKDVCPECLLRIVGEI